MGCTNSSMKNVMENNPLTALQIQQRIEAPSECRQLVIGGITMRYAWVSQRGYYPDAVDKDNQDAFAVLPNFGKSGTTDQAFMGVFDGHGRDGHHCARYVRDNLPNNILDSIERISAPSVKSADIKSALREAHLLTNEKMHAQKKFDDSLSGTTSVSILLRGRTLFISNVGDSRAILVSKKEGRLVAKPLSNDQTPYRKDERERIKKTGARVLSMDQIEGLEPVHENWGDLNLGEDIDEGGDPPRVWSAHGDYPGTAFTRSIGDRIAEDCGVYAEPEILERDLEPDDKYVIIASDGVFEFITNQMVADEFAFHDNPLIACKAVVAQAYHLWLQYEVRTDDITMIAMYLDDVPAPEVFAPSSSFYPKSTGAAAAEAVAGGLPVTRQASLELGEQRPVRRVMSREKRKHMIEVQLDPIGDEADDDISEAEMKALIIPKSEADAEIIGSAIKSNFLFQHLNATQRTAVIDVMKEVPVKEGDRIIRQGDRGDRFYVIDHGRFEVRVRPNLPPPSAEEESLKNGREKSNSIIMVDRAPTACKIAFEPNVETLGNVVHIYESNANSHPGFGELSLMYGKPRAASVIALTDGKLWSLDRRVFARVVLRPKDIRRSIIRTLKNVELLKCLTLDQLQRLTDLLSEESHPAGSYIIRQGDPGETFYIVVSGTAECTIDRADGSGSDVVLRLKENDYFGERALLEAKPRAANVIATSDVKVLYIGKQSFEEVLGSLKTIIDNDRIRREAIAAATHSALVPHKFADMTIYGIVTTDVLGTLFMGTFGEKPAQGKVEPNITVRTFLLSQVERRSLKDSLSRFMDAVKVVLLAAPSTVLIPRPLSFIQDINAVHITFNQPIVADLSSFVRSHSGAVVASAPMVSFSFACLVSALEALHAMQIVYRAVQPESLYVDAMGRIVVLDYRVCKIGLAATGRTFTICGVADYLAPEQIAQSGHSYPVDLWSMGVLLYEVSVGSHPFAASSEVATYSKISSFGTKVFPTLDIPETVQADCKSLINQLLVPVPSARIGAGASGFAALRRHPFFKAYADQWPAIANGTYESPFASMAKNEKDAMMLEVVDPAEFETFSKEYSGRTITEDWVGSLAF